MKRLAKSAVGLAACGRQGFKLSGLVALDRQDRVQHPVDRDAAARERRGNGIDEERHVVVQDADPCAAAARFAFRRRDLDDGRARRARVEQPGREVDDGFRGTFV